MNHPKLIFLDLDFTLLRSDKTISEYTAGVLKRCQENGILVGFSTSRGTTNIKNFIEQIQPDVVISNGGASIYYKNQLLHTETFTLEETRTLLSNAYKICGSNCELTLDTIDEIYWNRKEDKSQNYSSWAIFDDFSDFKLPALKFCVQTDDAEKAKQIASSVKNIDYLPFSDIPWYKFSSSLATKENAIEFISEYLNISFENMIAFGDDYSDAGMLKLCGTGIAMGNAIDSVKAIADDVTKSNDEDGVAWYLENKYKI